MFFDNRNIVVRLNMRRYLTLLAYIILIVVFLVSGLFRKTVLGYDKEVYAMFISVVYLLYVVFTFMVNYNFFSYNDEGEKLIFRFVSLRPFDNKKRAIEIKKENIMGYKIEKSFLSMGKKLILIAKTNKGIANYPPISITALSRSHIRMLENSLGKFV